jgi:ubiquinone/menaquinone biosynthesis C-methylase UbiE
MPSPEIEFVQYQAGGPGYQDVAAYDRKRYEGPANEYKFRVMAAAYHRMLGSLRGKHVLDVGCGTGRGVADFAQEAESVTGCDASVDMLAYAQRKVEGKNCKFIHTFAQHLPLPSNSFDVVTSLNFLHLFSIETQTEMVAEMKRVLKPGGILLLEFDNGLQGGIIGFYKRWTARESGAMLPWEINRIIGSGVRVTAIHGAVFPVLWRAMWHFPKISAQIEKLAYFPPLNRLAHRVYYRIVKEG